MKNLFATDEFETNRYLPNCLQFPFHTHQHDLIFLFLVSSEHSMEFFVSFLCTHHRKQFSASPNCSESLKIVHFWHGCAMFKFIRNVFDYHVCHCSTNAICELFKIIAQKEINSAYHTINFFAVAWSILSYGVFDNRKFNWHFWCFLGHLTQFSPS